MPGARRLACLFMLFAALAATPAVAGSKTLSLKEIREDGVVRQKWDTSCGAAALATVLTYTFNDPVSEREVARGLLMQTEPLTVRHRGGFSLLDMKRYAEQRGYRVRAYRDMGLNDISSLQSAILPVSFHGYNHYVVFKGVTADGRIRIGDPAFGNRTINRKSFDRSWIDGIAFLVTRGG